MKKLLLPLLVFIAATSLRAQLFVDTSYTANQMINSFFNSAGVAISNVTYSGTPSSLGFFEGSQSNIGLNAGLLMTSGSAPIAVGPNNSESAGKDMGILGTPWLNALIPGYATFDASVIEMDIVPSSDTLSFKYVFGSEEYKEFVGTSYNDLFAFFIEGPGFGSGDSIYVQPDTVITQIDSGQCWICVDTFLINSQTWCYFDSLTMVDTCITYVDTITQWCYNDPNCSVPTDTIIYPGYWYYSPGGHNLAMVPNTNLAVSINNLNQNQFSQYFVDNAGGQSVQYDGFTTPLHATALVQAGQTYHVRIAIADAGDHIFDSGVFIGIESLNGDSLLPVVPQFLVGNQPGSTTVAFQNQSLWATKWHWDFGDGTTSEERFPEHIYAQLGNYNVVLTASNWCSSKKYVQTVSLGSSSTYEVAADFFQIYPNPAHGQVSIDLKNAAAADAQLFDLNGRTLLARSIQDGEQVNLNEFGKGVFTLRLIVDGRVFTQKIVNQ